MTLSDISAADGVTTETSEASENFFCVRVTFTRTVSPGAVKGTKNTRPS